MLTNSSLGQLVAVDKTDYQRDTCVRVNVKKRRERIFHKTVTSDINVNIAYVESSKVSPSKNLLISDRSNSLPENTIITIDPDEYIELPFATFQTRSKKFLVTDRFTLDTPTQPPSPVFYYHTLKYFNPTLSDWTSRTLLTVEFLDALTMEKYIETTYLLEEENGRILSNYLNTYIDGVSDITMVRYSVKITVGATSTIRSYQEIINNKPIFHQAIVQDMDEWGNLLSGSDAYLQEEVPGNTYYRVTLPYASNYAYKDILPSRIYLLSPTTMGLEDPWNVRIVNGEFMSSVPTGRYTTRSAKYYVPEYLNQGFTPYPYFKYIPEEEAVRVSNTVIKLSRNAVHDVDKNFFVTLKVYDVDSQYIVAAYTTDTNLINTYVSGRIAGSTLTWKDAISSVDEYSGFVELITEYIPEGRKILASYYTIADDIDFIDVDFNPVNNEDVLSKRIVIYVNPETANTGTLTNTIQYLEIDQLGRIIYSSQAHSGGLDPATTKLRQEDFTTEGLSKRTFYYDIESTVSGLASRTSGPYSAFIDDFSFIDKYSVSTRLASLVVPSGQSTDHPYDHFVLNLAENPGFLILGDIKVGESETPYNSTIYDLRIRGGGIKPVKDIDAEDIEPEVQFYWDKELPYPGGNSFLVELPEDLLEENDGDYTVDQLKEIVGKHADFGSYSIIKTYGDLDPIIVSGISIGVLVSGVTVADDIYYMWTTYGSGVTYDLYMSTDSESYTETLSGLIDTTPYNSCVVSGLMTNVTYYAYLEATRNGIISNGPVVAVLTTA